MSRVTIASALDGVTIGPVRFNKTTSFEYPGGCRLIEMLTIYNADGNIADEQITFTPRELLRFCREVLKRANSR